MAGVQWGASHCAVCRCCHCEGERKLLMGLMPSNAQLCLLPMHVAGAGGGWVTLAPRCARARRCHRPPPALPPAMSWASQRSRSTTGELDADGRRCLFGCLCVRACAWLCIRTAVNTSIFISPSCPRHMLAVALVYGVNKRETWRQVLVKDGCAPAEKLIAAVSELHGREGCKELACFLDELLQRAGYTAAQP